MKCWWQSNGRHVIEKRSEINCVILSILKYLWRDSGALQRRISSKVSKSLSIHTKLLLIVQVNTIKQGMLLKYLDTLEWVRMALIIRGRFNQFFTIFLRCQRWPRSHLERFLGQIQLGQRILRRGTSQPTDRQRSYQL